MLSIQAFSLDLSANKPKPIYLFISFVLSCVVLLFEVEVWRKYNCFVNHVAMSDSSELCRKLNKGEVCLKAAVPQTSDFSSSMKITHLNAIPCLCRKKVLPFLKFLPIAFSTAQKILIFVVIPGA